ncbi:hypothetical protein [Dyella sp. 20L07]|uniref:hypothetical protein n=1 Tax=Dyella sp. 20L07 TaxID=3384240 RepID=UPI003D2D7786
MNQWQLLVPATFGVTDRLNVMLTAGAAHASSDGHRSNDGAITDTQLRAQYMWLAPDADGTRPAISVAYTHRFPTGAYDRLHTNPLNGMGDGASVNTLSLFTQKYFWLLNDRPLRWRTSLSWSPAPSRVGLNGMSVYGTEAGFHGYAQLGRHIDVSTSLEYSIDRHWALSADLAWDHAGQVHVLGLQPGTVQVEEIVRDTSHSSWVYSVAPAVQYNFTPDVGLIAGAQISFAGHANRAFVDPQVALNMTF